MPGIGTGAMGQAVAEGQDHIRLGQRGQARGFGIAGRQQARKKQGQQPLDVAMQRNASPQTQFPATVMRSMRMEPTWREPRVSTSLPMATMPLNMSLRLPAMVISSTG